MQKHSDWPHRVTKKDLRIEYYRGSGKGGQHRNKKLAFRRLADKLVPIMKQELSNVKVEKSDEIIRTYHEPRGTVKDKRLKGKTYNYGSVVKKKGLSDIINELVNKCKST